MAETNANIDYRLQLTPAGYALEMAIPMAYIDAKVKADDPDAESWREARIWVGVYDLDSGAHAPDTLHWQPYRCGQGAIAGAQLFVRK
ncbi:MAG: hypothetical protein AAF529_23025 [Pseudomonadota bacterium]